MSSAKHPSRFSRRIFKVFTLSLLSVSAVFTTHFLYVQKQRMEGELVERGWTLASLLASAAKTAVFAENATLVQDALQGVADRKEVLAAAIFTADRILLTSVERRPASDADTGTLTDAELQIVGSPQFRSECRIAQGNWHIEIYCPVLIRAPEMSGRELYFDDPAAPTREEIAGFVKLVLDRGPLRRELAGLLLRSLLLLFILLLICVALAFLLARRVTEPLEQLTEAVRAFGAGTEPAGIREIPRTSDDEIGRLAEAFGTMIRDLEERGQEKERLAERLRESQKMEAVGTLSQGISHDFKNILSTLKGAVHILQRGSPGNEFVLKYTGKMQVSLDRARDLVERLVVFSRTRQILAGPVDLAALLTKQAPMLREALGEGVRFHSQVPCEPVWVSGDAPSLEQLLLNLTYNARDAMPEGGSLFLRLQVVAGASPGEAGTARITVGDTGVGMDPEVRRRLFDPYFTTKDVSGGIGLGLSIVHGIVEQHHGRIEVESEPGEGTTFQVDLPLAVQVEEGLPQAADPTEAARG